jgi:manganese/iron transport system substrate-binding protein
MTRLETGRHALWLGLLFLSCLLMFSCSTPEIEVEPTSNKDSKNYLSGPSDLSPLQLAEGEKVRVVATTSIVGDIVANIGGEAIDLTILMPANVDPHSFEPTPTDLRAVSDAHIVFINGLGLEIFLEEMLENVGKGVPVLSLSIGLDPMELGEEVLGQGDESEEAEDHDHDAVDPHVWFDPTNVMVWIGRVSQALSLLDPGNASFYENKVEEYHEQLRVLDQWITVKVSHLSAGERRIISDHRVFGYFAERYGFDIVGAVIPVFSSASEPSAREIAELHEVISDLQVKVIFVGESVSPGIVEAVAQDTGTQLVRLYTGYLSDENGPAANYLDFMRYNVETIVDALSE